MFLRIEDPTFPFFLACVNPSFQNNLDRLFTWDIYFASRWKITLLHFALVLRPPTYLNMSQWGVYCNQWYYGGGPERPFVWGVGNMYTRNWVRKQSPSMHFIVWQLLFLVVLLWAICNSKISGSSNLFGPSSLTIQIAVVNPWFLFISPLNAKYVFFICNTKWFSFL